MPSNINNNRVNTNELDSKYSTEELVILHGLKYDLHKLDEENRAKLLNKKKKWAEKLAGRYTHGYKASYNPRKARKYMTEPVVEKTSEIKTPKVKTHRITLPSSERLRSIHGWFHTTRLFVARNRRFAIASINYIEAALLKLPHNSPFIKHFRNAKRVMKPFAESPAVRLILGIAGVLIFLNLILDISIVIKSTFFKPLSDYEKTIPKPKLYWQRFKRVMMEGNRPSRMLNDLAWSTINLISLLIFGPAGILINAIVNLIGFSIDALNQTARGGYALKTHYQLLRKIKNDEIRIQLRKKIRSIWKSNLYRIVCSLFVIAGMVLFFFPPVPIAAVIGAGVALIAGSIATGLGERLWNSAKKLIRKRIAKNKSINQNVEPQKNSTNQTNIFKTLFKKKNKKIQDQNVNANMASFGRNRTPSFFSHSNSTQKVENKPTTDPLHPSHLAQI